MLCVLFWILLTCMCNTPTGHPLSGWSPAVSYLLCRRVPETVFYWPTGALHRIGVSFSRSVIISFIYICHCWMSAVFSPSTNCSLCISTDGQEGSWEARWQHPKPRCLLKRLSSDDNTKDLCVDSSVKANGLSRQQVCDACVSGSCSSGGRNILIQFIPISVCYPPPH